MNKNGSSFINTIAHILSACRGRAVPVEGSTAWDCQTVQHSAATELEHVIDANSLAPYHRDPWTTSRRRDGRNNQSPAAQSTPL